MRKLFCVRITYMSMVYSPAFCHIYLTRVRCCFGFPIFPQRWYQIMHHDGWYLCIFIWETSSGKADKPQNHHGQESGDCSNIHFLRIDTNVNTQAIPKQTYVISMKETYIISVFCNVVVTIRRFVLLCVFKFPSEWDNIWIMMMMTWLYIAEKSIFIFEWFSLIAPGNGVFFLACGQSSGWFPTQRPKCLALAHWACLLPPIFACESSMPRLPIPHFGWWLCYVCGMPIVCYYLSSCTLAPCMAPHQQPR